MAKKVELEVEVTNNIQPSLKALRDLKKQLKDTAAESSDFAKLTQEIKDMEDALEESKAGAKSFKDSLEEAPGPLGMIFQGMRKLEIATKSFGTAFKAIGIGLLVSLVAGLAAAFSESEGAMKKLQPLFIGLQKILGGIMEVAQPLLDIFLDLALKALPYITEGIGMAYSAIAAFFTYIKEMGTGVMKVWKGIFTFDFETIKEGVTQMGQSFGKTADSYTDSMKRFENGTKQMTKTEKEELEKRREAEQKALDERIKRMELQDKLDKAALDKLKEESLVLAKTEQEKLNVEKKFFELANKGRMQDLADRMKLYSKDSEEYKNLLVEKITAETEYIKGQSDLNQKQIDLNAKNNKELMESELTALNLRKAEGLVGEDEYQKSLYDIKVKYAADSKELADAEIQYQQFLTDKRKKQVETERALLFQGLQDQINVLDQKNAELQNDFQLDIERFNQKKALLEQQRAIELQAAENDQVKQLEIRKKYAEAIAKVESDITNIQRAENQARVELALAYVDTIAQFGAFLGQIAGKNKDIQKAALLIEQASAIARIVVNTAVANAKSVAAFPLTGGLPWTAINTASGAIGIANAVAATVKGINQINSTNTNTGTDVRPPSMGRNYQMGGLINGPRHSQGGTMIEAEGGEAVMTRGAVTMFAPLLSMMNQMGGGSPITSNLVIAPNDKPTNGNGDNNQPFIIKSYVVERDLTSEQERQARLKDLSTL
jgi:hypothetical protein